MGTLVGWIVAAVLNCNDSLESLLDLRLLDQYLVSLLHQYGDKQGSVKKPFRLENMMAYVHDMATYKPDIRSRPFWNDRRKNKTTSYEGYIAMAMDGEFLALHKGIILGEDADGSQPCWSSRGGAGCRGRHRG